MILKSQAPINYDLFLFGWTIQEKAHCSPRQYDCGPGPTVSGERSAFLRTMNAISEFVEVLSRDLILLSFSSPFTLSTSSHPEHTQGLVNQYLVKGTKERIRSDTDGFCQQGA